MTPLPQVCVTHGNCPDGSTAALLLRKAHPNLHIVWGTHAQIDDQVLTAARNLADGGTVWLTDICCSPEAMVDVIKILALRKGSLRVYEHHQTRKFLESLVVPSEVPSEIVFDMKRCASKIVFDVWKDRSPSLAPYEDLVRLVNDRDLWLNQDPRGPGLTKLHYILGDEEWKHRFLKNPSSELTEKEAVLVEYVMRKEQERIDKLLERFEMRTDDGGRRYGVVYGEGDSSELLHQAIVRFDLVYALHINLHSRKGSIRGRGDFDCALWAQARGGGGHRAASGFPVQFERPRF